VLDVAVGQCRRWRDSGTKLRVAVNLSPRNLLDRDLVPMVRASLDKWELPPGALQLEITESAIMADTRRAAKVAGELRSMGIRIALDDFGTGFSSFAHLKRLPVDEIKVDKSFVQNMAGSREDAAIVYSTIKLGKSLGLKTTAEGVENRKVHAQLADWGCDFAQGFYFGRPATAGELSQEIDELLPAHEEIAGPSRHWRPVLRQRTGMSRRDSALLEGAWS
jgi:EAL domain-containing protein (putative c-di-GMP-specific phosphodiesterase class I)